MIVKAPLVPLNLTEVVPAKLEPSMITLAPGAPLGGETELIAGAALTVKLAALVAVPAEVVTAIRPVAAPAGTLAVILLAELTTTEVADTPLKVTAVVGSAAAGH